nr:MAG TPA: hypothetical protein [Siphoviridae sp. cthRu26]
MKRAVYGAFVLVAPCFHVLNQRNKGSGHSKRPHNTVKCFIGQAASTVLVHAIVENAADNAEILPENKKRQRNATILDCKCAKVNAIRRNKPVPALTHQFFKHFAASLLLFELCQHDFGFVGQRRNVELVSSDLGGAVTRLALGLHVDIALAVDGQGRHIVLSLAVLVQLDDGASIVGGSSSFDLVTDNQCNSAMRLDGRQMLFGSGFGGSISDNLNGAGAVVLLVLDRRNLAACHNAGVGNLADFAGDSNAGLILVSADKVRILAQGSHLLGVDEHDLVAVDLLVEHVDSVHNAAVFDSGGSAVIHQRSALQGFHAVIVDFSSDRQRQLRIGFANRVAVAGQHSFIGQANALHSLLDFVLLVLRAHLVDVNVNALCNVLSIADVAVRRHSNGIAGHASKGVIHLCKRCHADFVRNLCRNHIGHNFRVNQVCEFGQNSICHVLISFVVCKLGILLRAFLLKFQSFGITHLFKGFCRDGTIAAVFGRRVRCVCALRAGGNDVVAVRFFQAGFQLVRIFDSAFFVQFQLVQQAIAFAQPSNRLQTFVGNADFFQGGLQCLFFGSSSLFGGHACFVILKSLALGFILFFVTVVALAFQVVQFLLNAGKFFRIGFIAVNVRFQTVYGVSVGFNNGILLLFGQPHTFQQLASNSQCFRSFSSVSVLRHSRFIQNGSSSPFLRIKIAPAASAVDANKKSREAYLPFSSASMILLYCSPCSATAGLIKGFARWPCVKCQLPFASWYTHGVCLPPG